MRVRIIAAALFALGLSCQQVLAWGAEGHQLTGSVADNLLSDNAKKQVKQILGFELRVAAPWPDCVRSVKKDGNTFKYVSDPRFNKPCKSFETPEETARMEDYVGRNWNACVHIGGKASCSDTYHFADVAIQHDHYDRSFAGTGDHDVVSAINAAIAVLKDKPAPAPFSIKDKKEALFLLAHFLGDIHQPLHVGAVYLNAKGKRLDPDIKANAKTAKDTLGGNSILFGGGTSCKTSNLHSFWDDTLDSLGTSASAKLIAKAKAVPPTQGPMESFAATWASDSVKAAQSAFKGVSFSQACTTKWRAKFTNRAAYTKAANKMKEDQLAKGGANLAQLLNAIWP